MNYFLLAETEFFRLINEAGDCNMETAYTAFATQVIELCNGNLDANRTIIALAYIEIELQHHPAVSYTHLDVYKRQLQKNDLIERVAISMGGAPSRYCLVRPINPGGDFYGELIIDSKDYDDVVKVIPFAAVIHNGIMVS